MRIVFAKSSLTLILVMLTVTINIGCVLSVLEQNQTTGTVEKPPESIFTVVDTTDVKNPTLVSSIHLPFRSGLNNNVVLSGKHGYVTTLRTLSTEELMWRTRFMPFAYLVLRRCVLKVQVAQARKSESPSDKLVAGSDNPCCPIDPF